MSIDDAKTLVSSRSWSATPERYSSLRYLQFKSDGTGNLVYGYGQTIFASIPFTWEIPSPGRLRLSYSEQASGRSVERYSWTESTRTKELGYSLVAKNGSGRQDIVNVPFEFSHALDVSEAPWPTGMEFPYELPRLFFGKVGTASGPHSTPSPS